MQQNIPAGTDLTTTVVNNWAPTVLSGTCTPATNWTVSSFQAVWCAGITIIQVEMLYSGSTITASSAGMVSPAVQVCTLPSTMWPPWQMWSIFQNANVSAGSVLINPTGTVFIQTFYPSQSIVSGNTIFFVASLPTG